MKIDHGREHRRHVMAVTKNSSRLALPLPLETEKRRSFGMIIGSMELFLAS
jgi:hypothetical protein